MTYTLMALNIAVFLLDLTVTKNRLLLWGMKENASIVSGQWWRLWTCNFLHGGFLHLAVRCLPLAGRHAACGGPDMGCDHEALLRERKRCKRTG